MDKLLSDFDEVAKDYGEPDSSVDIGELFFWAIVLRNQLADMMQENERLRIALEHYRYIDDAVYRMLAGLKATPDMRDPNSVAGRALDYRNKDSGGSE